MKKYKNKTVFQVYFIKKHIVIVILKQKVEFWEWFFLNVF